MTVRRPPPPSASLGDRDYIATYVATSTPDGIVGEWVDGVCPKVALEDLFDFAASSA